MKKSKKGQIGQTITWFVATLIIIFMSILFVLAVTFLSGKKTVSLDNNEINKEKLNRQSFQELQLVLNSNSDNEKISYLIKKWVIEEKQGNSDEAENKIKNSVSNILNKYEDCRIFEVYYGEQIKYLDEFLNNEDKIIISNLELNPETAFGRLQRTSETILLVDEEKARIKLYIGEC